MNVHLSIWDRLSRLVVVLLFIAGVAFAFFMYLPLFQKNQAYRKWLLALDDEVAQQERANRQLKAAIDALQNDPKTVERLAREKLGWGRTNEIVIRFEPPAPARGR